MSSASTRRLRRFLVNSQNPTAAALNLASAPASPPDRYAATQAALARVGDVAQMTVAAARVPGLTAAALLAASSVSADPTADLLHFSVTDPDPAVAQRLATAYAREFAAYRRRLDTSAVTAGLTDVQGRLARLEALGQGNSPLAKQLTTTTHQLEDLRALAASGSSAIPVGRAGNASVVQPRTTRNVALGLLAGVALGIGLAFLRDVLDPRVRSEDELRERLGLPVLGHIPRPTNAASSNGDLTALMEPGGARAEAFRILKTNLSISQRQHGVSSIVVTSTGEGDGKSTTAANLAVTLARAQIRVALVDLDLRNPRIDALFGLDRQPGLTSVAAGEATLVEAAVRLARSASQSRVSESSTHLECLPTVRPRSRRARSADSLPARRLKSVARLSRGRCRRPHFFSTTLVWQVRRPDAGGKYSEDFLATKCVCR